MIPILKKLLKTYINHKSTYSDWRKMRVAIFKIAINTKNQRIQIMTAYISFLTKIGCSSTKALLQLLPYIHHESVCMCDSKALSSEVRKS